MHNQPPSETTFAVATLGCKVNQADSEAIGEQMSSAGFVQRNFDEMADIYIVNTCTVTHLGDRSSRQLISQARRRHPDALLVVTGCYAELNPQAVAADRKSTRLNSSHSQISYAVFCLKKKK